MATPLPGDRAAWNDRDYPEVHSKGIDDGNPTIHVPVGSAIGDIAVWDGAKWVTQQAGSGDILPPIMTLGTAEGVLQTGASPFKIYNRYDTNRQIVEVFLSVGTAPTGADLIVDVKLDGTSIFSGGNEAKISAGSTTGSALVFLSDIWYISSYLSWEITQIGSSEYGSDLAVHIIHNAYLVGGSGSGGSGS